MKKYLLIPVVFLALVCGTQVVHALTGTENLTICAEREGWTYGSLDNYPTESNPGENPVAYYNTFFKIWHCYRDIQVKDEKRIFWVPHGWFGWRSIESFANKIGFPATDWGSFVCMVNGSDGCEKDSRECRKACGDGGGPDTVCGRKCTGERIYCGNRVAITCEGELEAFAKAYASKLAPDVPKEPECGSSEYLVSGRCQSVFELCGRDSLFQYNPSTKVCTCPDPYIPSNGECIHEDDLYPLAEPPTPLPPPPPPNEPPPTPYVPLPPIVNNPPPSSPPTQPPADGSNAFCQPPGAQPLSYNEYGIPIANAQIYTNVSVITEIQGEVLVKTKNAPRWVPAYKGQRLTVEDKIKTGRTGRCAVKFANSSIMHLRPISQMEIVGPKHPCWCVINMKRGYLNMKFRRTWNDPKKNDPCAQYIYTPTAIAGGGYDGHRPMYDYYENENIKVAYNVLEIPLASAADNQIILHAEHDEETQVSKFYVEKGAVAVSDVDETASVTLSAGETMSVTPDTVPHPMDVKPAAQVAGQWWEDWDETSGIPFFVWVVLYVVGLVFIFRFVRKSKRGFLVKTGMFILGFILANIIISLLMSFL